MDLDFAQLQAFRATAELGTLDAAAKALHVTPSAISQRLKALETQVGRVLLQRTKPVVVTDSGEVVLQLARQIEQLSRDATRRLGDHDDLQQVIPLVINGDSLAMWAMDAIEEVSAHMCVEIIRENEDHSASLLRAGKVMAVVSSEATPVQGCAVTYLGAMRYRPMAAAGFVDEFFSAGLTAETITTAPVVVFDRKDRLQDAYMGSRWRKHVDPPRNYIPSSHDYSEAVLRGIGWGLIPEPEATQLEEAGDLIDIDPGRHQDVKLYWQQWKLSSQPLDRLARAINKAAKAHLI